MGQFMDRIRRKEKTSAVLRHIFMEHRGVENISSCENEMSECGDAGWKDYELCLFVHENKFGIVSGLHETSYMWPLFVIWLETLGCNFFPCNVSSSFFFLFLVSDWSGPSFGAGWCLKIDCFFLVIAVDGGHLCCLKEILTIYFFHCYLLLKPNTQIMVKDISTHVVKNENRCTICKKESWRQQWIESQMLNITGNAMQSKWDCLFIT